jgi:hypothetical protein
VSSAAALEPRNQVNRRGVANVASIYHSKITPNVFTATSAAAGYPATNLGNEQIDRPWKAATAGAETCALVWPSTETVMAVLLTDVNFTTANITRSTDGTTFANAVAFTSYADKHTDRRRGLVLINVAGLRGIRIEPTGSSTDGAAWRVGAAYVYRLRSVMPRMYEYGGSYSSLYPNVRRELPNGRDTYALTGAEFLRFTLPFDRKFSEDVQELHRRARLATVGLDLEDAALPELLGPVEAKPDELGETINYVNSARLTLELREVT